MIRMIPRNAKGKVYIVTESGILIATSASSLKPGDIVIIAGNPGTVQKVDEANVYIEFLDEFKVAEVKKVTEIFEELSEIARVHEVDEKDVSVLLGLFV